VSELQKAQLIFLDAIERRQSDLAEALRGQPETLKAIMEAVAEAIVKALQANADSVGRAVSYRPVPKEPQSLQPVIEALGAVANGQVMAANKVVGELSRQLGALSRPRKWKFDIDRNFQTGKIQGVTAEAVE
jgi:hypothetical protein